MSGGNDTTGGAPRYQWQPTTEEIAERAGIPPSLVERFDHNTSPLEQAWTADVLAESAASINEYPAASYIDLREAAAEFNGVDPREVVPGAGADELILLAARALLAPADVALQVLPTYPLYEIATAQSRAELVSLAAPAPDFALPHGDLLSIAPRCAVVWLCSPNNPTGAEVDIDAISSILQATAGIVVVDAAYAEFSGADWAPLVRQHDNLLVLRTLSKAFGLAGARVGYGLAASTLVDTIDGVRPPGSISSMSAKLGAIALRRPELMREAVAQIGVWRRQLVAMLEEFGFRAVPAATNFVLCEVGGAAPAIRDGLLADGLVVRDYPKATALGGYLRFTVRTPAAHARLRDAISSVLG